MANQIVLNKIKRDAVIVTVKAPAGTVNGSILALGAQDTEGLFAATAPSAVTLTDLAMVLAVPLSYEADKVQNNFVIGLGDLVRAYVPYKGMVVTIPVANITATNALGKNKFVVVKANQTKPECLDAVVGTETVVFKIDELVTVNGVASAMLRCVRA